MDHLCSKWCRNDGEMTNPSAARRDTREEKEEEEERWRHLADCNQNSACILQLHTVLKVRDERRALSKSRTLDSGALGTAGEEGWSGGYVHERKTDKNDVISEYRIRKGRRRRTSL